MTDILSSKTGKKIIMLGNEAIVRGAIESGVQFVSTYPGTPASEIGDTFSQISKKQKIYFEFSINEKVALEAAAGAAFSGLRTLVAMKHFGLNVASDFLMPLMYSGVPAGLVIVVADDPGCSSSAQSEQNSRAYSYLAHIPTLEPANPQECKDFVKAAFEISERFQVPVMIRETTRVALQSGPTKLGIIQQRKRKGKFVKQPQRFITMPPRVLEMKKELLKKCEQIKQQISKDISLNKAYHNQSLRQTHLGLGIVTSGISFLYTLEALKELGVAMPVLKIDLFYPLPEKNLTKFTKNLKKVLVIEELEPYLEKELRALAQTNNPRLIIWGKNCLSQVNELRPEDVTKAIAKLAGKKWQSPPPPHYHLSKRLPQLCPGCPYWLTFQAVKNVVDTKKTVFGGEIGCYMLAGGPPFCLQDYLYCMGSSISLAHGIKKISRQKIIAFVGDSSFFHAGIPGLINAVYHQSNPLIIILDNQTTAMTGCQPHPGVDPKKTKQTPVIKIEEIVKACGVKNLKIIDPVNTKEMEGAIREFLTKPEISVIISRRPCKFIK